MHQLLIALASLANQPATNAITLDYSIKATASDGQMNDSFGWAVASDGQLVAIGAFGDDPNDGPQGNNVGSVYIFERSGKNQLLKLTPPDGANQDAFGHSVAISNKYIVVGAYGDDDRGSISGSVYIYSTTDGRFIRKITAHDGSMFDRFGISLALTSEYLAVGANGDDAPVRDSGSVYLYESDTWDFIHKFTPDIPHDSEVFGNDVALFGNYLLAGAPYNDCHGTSAGRALLFDIQTRKQVRVFYPDLNSDHAIFGYSVDIEGSTVAISAELDDTYGLSSGAAYLFDLATPNAIARLTPTDAAPGQHFGRSVSIDGNLILAGAWEDTPNGPQSGSAYVFDHAGNQLAKLVPSDGGAFHSFGQDVALSNGIAVVGAHRDDDNGLHSGSVYLFNFECEADFDGDYRLSFFDISLFIAYYTSLHPSADINLDGNIDFFDVSTFLDAYAEGCPLYW